MSLHHPLRFEPFLRPLVWGGRRLAERLGKKLPPGQPFGESWEISDHPLHRSVVATRPYAGRSIRDLMESEKAAFLGPAAKDHAVFPWLVKFLDAADWLSVQVHPDETAVKRLWPGEGPKTEAWFVLAADAGSRVYAGLRPGIDEHKLRQALLSDEVAMCLHSFEPRAGDCVFLPAGTVHAVGGGVLMAEIQQTSDATFRLFDWNRVDAQGKQRQLHVEEAMASIHWDQGPIEPIRAADSPGKRRLIRCPYFDLEYVHMDEPFACRGTGRLQVLVALTGSGRWDTLDGDIAAGQAWVLPADMSETLISPKPFLTALLCTLP